MGGGGGLEIGYESVTPIYQRITFRDLAAIHSLPNGDAPDPCWPEAVLSIHPTQISEYGSTEYMGTLPPVRNVTYHNIRRHGWAVANHSDAHKGRTVFDPGN